MADPAGDVDYGGHGAAYAARRRTDPRIAAVVHAALGPARTVVNVGAGAGSYEPVDRSVTAVEPSAAMRAQRGSPAVAASAEALPFADSAFDAGMAVMTVHQWRDVRRGLRELRRVTAGAVVVLTCDPARIERCWVGSYVPDVLASERRRFPPLELITTGLAGSCEVTPVPIPRDCVDGFIEAFYGRPEALLDPAVRAAQSAWAFADPVSVERGLDRLRTDLGTGEWDLRHGALRTQARYDGSVCLVVTR